MHAHKDLLCPYNHNDPDMRSFSLTDLPAVLTLRNSEKYHHNFDTKIMEKDNCTLKGVVGFRGPPSTVAPGL
jgi:hypothetical protein